MEDVMDVYERFPIYGGGEKAEEALIKGSIMQRETQSSGVIKQRERKTTYLKEKEADHSGASKGTERPIAARGSRLRTKPLMEQKGEIIAEK